jgi:hypothetical protein
MRTLFLLALVAVPALAQNSIYPDESSKKAARQLEPESLSAESKAFLKGKMKSHIKDMRDLSIAVALVNLSEVQRLAQGIANAPRLDSAMGPASQLPSLFFDMQNQLRKTAQELSDAGKAGDMNGSIEKYQSLIAQCAACHATFKAQLASIKK